MADGALPGILYRAEVIDDDDKDDEGKVKVWIPDLMPSVDKSEGVWAIPSNNVSGTISIESGDFFVGSCTIPKKGSYILVFFEGKTASILRYISGLSLKTIKVPAECRVGSNKRDKWVVFKSQEGRCIVVSDDPDDARVEITGKKRKLANPPAGDTESVYSIDDNQTTILLDERDGNEKLLIRTHKGDFINFDILNQKMNLSIMNGMDIECNTDIRIGTNGSFHVTAGSIRFNSKNNFSIQSAVGDVLIGAKTGSIYLKAAKDVFLYASKSIYQKTLGKLIAWATTSMTLHSDTSISTEASLGLNTDVMVCTPVLNATTISGAGGTISASGITGTTITSVGPINADSLSTLGTITMAGNLVVVNAGPAPAVPGTPAVIIPPIIVPPDIVPGEAITSPIKAPADADKPDAEGERK